MEATTDPWPSGEATMALAAAPFDAGLVAVTPAERPFILRARASSWAERGGEGGGGRGESHSCIPLPPVTLDLTFDLAFPSY